MTQHLGMPQDWFDFPADSSFLFFGSLPHKNKYVVGGTSGLSDCAVVILKVAPDCSQS